jgi:hypothetical protein
MRLPPGYLERGLVFKALESCSLVRKEEAFMNHGIVIRKPDKHFLFSEVYV